ncbi:MAG: hypothetical protein J5Y07_04360 [Dehalobacter sp.]|uniref:Uncharacterized protein n=3 Tax=Dehalobacter restrictus TaxID=55583 RepID=A0A857DKF9_9FIRM|nr:hypothetical protein DEHRE_02180 [Dehalobacter restrictus DSM 9455]MCG1024934.1 hypothetical protein [Dehalobacter sp.]QHA01850.1 hypothetical protein GQ588_02400 [Dehalobacter restrictus]
MRRVLIPFILIALLLYSGCNSAPATQQVPPDQTVNQESRTFSKGFTLENQSDPELTDRSSNYITEEFTGIQGVIWNPIRFLDNDRFLYLATNMDNTDPWIYCYNLKTKKADKLYPSEGGFGNLFIQNIDSYSMVDSTALVSIKNNQVSNKVLFEDWKQKNQQYKACDAIANPRTGKVVLVDNNTKKCTLTDLNLEKAVDLPFMGVYSACWADDNNIIFGAFDNFKERQGSAVITYNIQNEVTAKTYLGDDQVFVGPGRDSDDYCEFAYQDDYHGSPGALGVIGYAQNKIIFFEFKNIADMDFQYHWIIAAATEKPIDWEAWGRTTEGTVRLCVYDVATNAYIIRDKALPRPAGMIVSPDGRTIVYKTFGKDYINREK